MPPKKNSISIKKPLVIKPATKEILEAIKSIMSNPPSNKKKLKIWLEQI